MAQWAKIDWQNELFENADETVLSESVTALENGYTNPGGGHSRFPGLKPFVTLPGTRTILTSWRNDMIAVTREGRFHRIDQAGTVEDVTGVPLAGDGRAIFTETEDELVAAAGQKIIRLNKDKTEVLSEQAPETTHVAFIDGYLLAIEPFSGRFFHSNVGNYNVWDPLDVFSAEGKPDDLNAMVVTPYRELLLCGVDSIEQFERASSGTAPFFRRWTTGEGVFAPYTLIATKTGTYAINELREFVRFSAQVSRPESDDIGLSLENIDNWDQAWTERIHIKGQKFILLQAPFATNVYGTMGVTLLFDYRAKRWASLYGWDESQGNPARWPGWSYKSLWGRHFVGIDGGVMELDVKTFKVGDNVQRMMARTAHIEEWGRSRIDDLRIRFKRGVDVDRVNARIGVRCNRDNQGFSRWAFKEFGAPGKREMVLYFGGWGIADTWQFEYQVTDAVSTEFVGMDVYVERMPR